MRKINAKNPAKKGKTVSNFKNLYHNYANIPIFLTFCKKKLDLQNKLW